MSNFSKKNKVNEGKMKKLLINTKHQRGPNFVLFIIYKKVIAPPMKNILINFCRFVLDNIFDFSDSTFGSSSDDQFSIDQILRHEEEDFEREEDHFSEFI